MSALPLFVRGFACCVAVSLLSSVPALATPPPIASLEAAAALRPGQFLWSDDGTSAAPPTIIVNIGLQQLYVYRGDMLVAVSTVSTGKPGKDTPVGTFEILQKKEMHRSNLYDDAPMPFMQRLTWDGIAIHAGAIPGHPASHGCIRVPSAFAKKLFGITKLGAKVVVSDYVVTPDDALGTAPMIASAPAGSLPGSVGAAVAEANLLSKGREVAALE